MNKIRTRINEKTITNTSIERHPVPVLGIDYKVRITYKNVKFVQVDVEEKLINISLPNKYKKVSNVEILDLAINKLYEQVASTEIERAMEKSRIMMGFAPEEYEIEKMKMLGKCEDGKITINPEIVKYSRKLIDYVVLHQYCHLKFKTHAKGFYELIKQYEPNYKKYENILKVL